MTQQTSRPPATADLDELDMLFSALGHRTRRAILLVLQANGGVMTSGAIANRFDCSWPTTSRHLRVLEQAALVRPMLRGRERVYQLDASALHDLGGKWIARFDATTFDTTTFAETSPDTTRGTDESRADH